MTVTKQSVEGLAPAESESISRDRHRPTARAWIIVGLLVVFQVIAFADKAVLGLVAPQAMPELGLTPTQFGFIGSAFFFLYAIVSVITGILASKFSVRWIILALGVTWAVMQFPMLLGGGAAVLLATRIILGGAEGPATAMSLTSAHTWFHPSRRALPSNLIAIGSTLGPVFAAPFIAWVIGMWGWRWAFGALGIIGLVWITVWLIFGGDGPYSAGGAKTAPARDDAPVASPAATDPETDTDTVDLQKPVNIWYALFSLAFLAALLGGASNFWVQGFLTTWLPQYLDTVIGLSLSEVGVYTTFPWVLGALVLLVLGWLGQRLLKSGRSAHVAIAVPFGLSTAVAGLAFLLVPVAPDALSVLLLTIAGGCSLVFPMAASAIGYAVGPKQRPIMMATLGGFAAFGAIISPILVGWLMTAAGYQAPASGTEPTVAMAVAMADGVHSAFLITGVFLVVAGLVAALLLRPERLGRRLQEHHARTDA
ncbi:MFS transporter [Corynebacterium halotolerans]|uniref:MFS transporter n=1 Tax=Corynebacterium halotolerans TaxID=225326 RepID=UPI00047D09D6